MTTLDEESISYIPNGLVVLPSLLITKKPRLDDFTDVTTPPSDFFQKKRFQFDPAKHLKQGSSLQKQVRHLANMTPCFAEAFLKHCGADDSNYNIFESLWPSLDLVQAAPTAETRVALGVLGLLAHLATVSPQVLSLLARAPTRPNYEFHMVNALFGTIKYTVKVSGDTTARMFLLQKSLLQLVHLSNIGVPEDVGKPPSDTPFPLLARFTHAFVDLLACTPRLTVDFRCSDPKDEDVTHRFGYRLQGHFLDALRVRPDETCNLAEIMSEFENELIQGLEEDEVPSVCNQGHRVDVYEYYYHYECGPPPLLFFEAITSSSGIPRHCLVPSIMLTEHHHPEKRSEYTYHLIALVAMMVEQQESDVELQLFQPGEDFLEVKEDATTVVALVIYIRSDQCIPLETLPSLLALAECGSGLNKKKKKTASDDSVNEDENENHSLDEVVDISFPF